MYARGMRKHDEWESKDLIIEVNGTCKIIHTTYVSLIDANAEPKMNDIVPCALPYRTRSIIHKKAVLL